MHIPTNGTPVGQKKNYCKNEKIFLQIVLYRIVFSFFLIMLSVSADMGLDIACGHIIERVGSYSGVQRQRVVWIKAEARRQEVLGNIGSAQQMKKSIRSSDHVDYETFEMTDGWLDGTRAFVDHSDCDGIWEASEAIAILEAVTTLEPFFDEDAKSYYFDDHGHYYLRKILMYCVRHKKDIVFC